MRLPSFIRAPLAALLLLAGGAAHAQTVETDQVRASLVSSRESVAPGEVVTLALRLEVADGWHTYWRNPGDSGAPTRLRLEAPPGWEILSRVEDAEGANDVIWPAPALAPFGPLMNYGFEGETLYPVRLRAPTDAEGPATIAGDVSWLVCKDICIPQEGRVSLTLDTGPTGADDPRWAQPIADALAALPRAAADLNAAVSAEGVLSVAGPPVAGGAIESATFFSYDGALIDHAAPQVASFGTEGVSIRLPTLETAAADRPALGVLVIERGGARSAFEIEASPGPALPGTGGQPIVERSATDGLGLPLALLFAVLGGLVLNVMPCVFPVLTLKALKFAQLGDGGARRQSGAFFLGAMGTFLALGALVAGLNAAGAAVGWGFQLQDPWVIGALALVFFAIGLNLLGVFAVGGSLQNVGAGIGARDGDLSSFGTGALAVVAATPCTAPFMTSALAFAATQGPAAGLGVFAAMGLGFALPVLALGWVPAARKLLPRPGPWLARLKEAFAFPMFATVAWLGWVLAGQAGQTGVALLLSALILFAFAVWAMRAFGKAPARIAALACAVAAFAAVAVLVRPAPATLTAERWSPARVAELAAEGRPAFVTFTADWCVSCKVNERVALSSARVARAFAAEGVTYLRADWTRRDPEIAAALAAIGRPGVPAYVFIPGGGAPARVLPQTFPLTETDVIGAISGTGG